MLSVTGTSQSESHFICCSGVENDSNLFRSDFYSRSWQEDITCIDNSKQRVCIFFTSDLCKEKRILKKIQVKKNANKCSFQIAIQFVILIQIKSEFSFSKFGFSRHGNLFFDAVLGKKNVSC